MQMFRIELRIKRRVDEEEEVLGGVMIEIESAKSGSTAHFLLIAARHLDVNLRNNLLLLLPSITIDCLSRLSRLRRWSSLRSDRCTIGRNHLRPK
jgi:hypothetical protein